MEEGLRAYQGLFIENRQKLARISGKNGRALRTNTNRSIKDVVSGHIVENAGENEEIKFSGRRAKILARPQQDHTSESSSPFGREFCFEFPGFFLRVPLPWLRWQRGPQDC